MTAPAAIQHKPILVLGATGYVGGRLVSQLLEKGYRVRAAGRSLEKLRDRAFSTHPNVETVRVDVLDKTALSEAAAGCGAAYYLVHSMQPGVRDFAETDRIAARNMIQASEEAGIGRIIYLGGLGDEAGDLSNHLRSRAEVGHILRTGSVPVTILRAATILGSGSAPFEIIRYLVDRLPVMTAPRWIGTPCQPIAVRNVLYYLVGCLENESTAGETYDIGGPDVLTYKDLLTMCAQEAGLSKRHIFRLPVLTPRLSSYWIHLVTPVSASLARPLILGLANPVVCAENRIRDIIPQELLTCREAIRAALDKIKQLSVETSFSDAGYLRIPEWVEAGDAKYAGGTILECNYRITLKARPEDAWFPIKIIGGRQGWYFGNWLWVLRGIMDRLIGGFGLRRGRRHPSDLHEGDYLDFWRVISIKNCERLRLLAEMKLPGEAILEFVIEKNDNGTIDLKQYSKFFPRGLWGIIYWYVLIPFHVYIFKGMLKSIARKIDKPVIAGPSRIRGG